MKLLIELRAGIRSNDAIRKVVSRALVRGGPAPGVNRKYLAVALGLIEPADRRERKRVRAYFA